MNTLNVLRARPALFFRLCGIRLEDFDGLVSKTYRFGLKASIGACLATIANARLARAASMGLGSRRSF